MIIAIDGPAGVGKSTVATKVSEMTGFLNINSGNLYRCVTLRAIEKGIGVDDSTTLVSLASTLEFSLKGHLLLLDGEEVEHLLHTQEIDSCVAKHSRVPEIRELINRTLRRLASTRNVVMEGRDIGTEVFPNADVKIYLTATQEARIDRRFNQGSTTQSREELGLSLIERDEIDKNKEIGPLRIAEDATIIDTSHLTIESVCERVIKKMGEVSAGGSVSIHMVKGESFAGEDQSQLQEKYLKTLGEFEEGDLLEGVVVTLSSDNVFIDIGYKSEGKVPIDEFKTIPAIGDSISVVLVSREGRNGEVVVSKQQADLKQMWRSVRTAFQEGTPIEGVMERSVRGGIEVSLGHNIRAFTPMSQVDVVRVDDPSAYIGQSAKFLVDQLYSEGKVKLVLSRRRWIEREVARKREEFFSKTSEGDAVLGEVKSFTSFGAFIDLGGFDGLLHVNDMSWGHVSRPKEFVKKGDKIELKVVKIDAEHGKINLSLKDFTQNPWELFESKYSVDDLVKGKVTKIVEFGAFIEIEEGIEGLAHVSQFSWIKRITHPRELLSLGDEVEAKILSYDVENKRVSLGLRQVMPNPWTSLEQNYPVGRRVIRKVSKVTSSGAFIELEEGIDGFLHIDDVSWIRRDRSFFASLNQGDELEVVVVEVNAKENKVRLGVKQLSEDPWHSLAGSVSRGSVLEGQITSITDFGLFVRVYGDIEGLVGKDHILDDAHSAEDKDPMTKYNVGDKVTVMVTRLDPGSHRLSLSIREYLKSQQNKEISKYIHDSRENATFTLGDLPGSE